MEYPQIETTNTKSTASSHAGCNRHIPSSNTSSSSANLLVTTSRSAVSTLSAEGWSSPPPPSPTASARPSIKSRGCQQHAGQRGESVQIGTPCKVTVRQWCSWVRRVCLCVCV